MAEAALEHDDAALAAALAEGDADMAQAAAADPAPEAGPNSETKSAPDQPVNGLHYLVSDEAAKGWNEPERMFNLLNNLNYYRNVRVDPTDPFNPAKNTLYITYSQTNFSVKDKRTKKPMGVTTSGLYVKSRRDHTMFATSQMLLAPMIFRDGEMGPFGNYIQAIRDARLNPANPKDAEAVVAIAEDGVLQKAEFRDEAIHPNAAVPGTNRSVYFQDLREWDLNFKHWVYACCMHPDGPRQMEDPTGKAREKFLMPGTNYMRKAIRGYPDADGVPGYLSFFNSEENMAVAGFAALGPIRKPMKLSDVVPVEWQREEGAHYLADDRLLQISMGEDDKGTPCLQAWIDTDPKEDRCIVSRKVFEEIRVKEVATTKKRTATMRSRVVSKGSHVNAADQKAMDDNFVLRTLREKCPSLSYTPLPVKTLVASDDGCFTLSTMPWAQQEQILQLQSIIVPKGKWQIRFPAGTSPFRIKFEFHLTEAWWGGISDHARSQTNLAQDNLIMDSEWHREQFAQNPVATGQTLLSIPAPLETLLIGDGDEEETEHPDPQAGDSPTTKRRKLAAAGPPVVESVD